MIEPARACEGRGSQGEGTGPNDNHGSIRNSDTPREKDDDLVTVHGDGNIDV